MNISGLFSGQSPVQIRVEESGSLHKVAIYSKYAPTGCSHSFCKYFSCDSGLWIQCEMNHKNIRLLTNDT